MKPGFTLIEVLAVILTLVVGIGSVIGLTGMARRMSGEAQGKYLGSLTASTVVYDFAPLGLTADPNDADKDGWQGNNASLNAVSYTLESSGHINGLWVRRVETSASADRLTANVRWANVVVDVFWGLEGNYITTVQERILRQGQP